MSRKLFEQQVDNNPNLSKRIAFGEESQETKNITFQKLIDWFGGFFYKKSDVGELKRKIIEIGIWNMVTTSSKLIQHELLDYTKIRIVSVIIRNDTNVGYYGLLSPYLPTYLINGGYNVSGNNIFVVRNSSGLFNTSNFSNTTINRGWIVIDYIE